MSKTQYVLVLVLAMMGGWIGDIMSSQIRQWELFSQGSVFKAGILPHAFLSKDVQARKGFEVIDNRGKLRVRLNKFGLTFFGEKGEELIALNVQGPYVTLYDRGTNTMVQVSPSGPCVVYFTQGQLGGAPLGSVSLPGGPRLACGQKDGKTIWQVPEGMKTAGVEGQQRSSTTAPISSEGSPQPSVSTQMPPATPALLPAESWPASKRIPHPACPHCFKMDCPNCYGIFEEVPGTGIIISRQLPDPAPLLPQDVQQSDNKGRPIWYIGRQPYVGPTDEEPVSKELPIPLIELKRIQARHSKEITSIPGVQGFGIGAKGFVVFLLPEKEVNKSQVPKVLEGVPVEVQLGGPFRAL